MARLKAPALELPAEMTPARKRAMSASRISGIFIATFVAILGAVYLWTGTLASMRTVGFDFQRLGDNEVLLVHGLTRQQGGGIKLGYIANHAPPRVGLFANHQMRYARNDLFGRSVARGDFFNFWFANLSLTELHDYLLHLEDIGKLPTETILVQMTTPNNDNGRYVIGYRGELPFELMFRHLEEERATTNALVHGWRRLAGEFQALVAHLSYRLDLFSIMSVPVSLGMTGLESRILDLDKCAAASVPVAAKPGGLAGRILSILPPIIRDPITDRMNQKKGGARASAQRYCSHHGYIAGALRYDGARNIDRRWRDKELRLNENPLKNWSVELQRDDDIEIARHVAGMAAIARRNGRRFALIIPPVYETARRSVVNEVVDRALARVPDVRVFDGRGFRDRPEMFINYDHASDLYVRTLADRLRDAGIISLE